jgi:hypothetical protein
MRKRLADWWFAPAPAERLAGLRILIGGFACGYLASRFPELVKSARLPPALFEPLGVVRVLGAPLPSAVAIAIAAATLALFAAFTLGFAYRVIAPLAAAALVWTLSYRTSWGQTFHTENVLVLHVIALACSPAADVWAIGNTRKRGHAGYGWGIKLLVALTVATYVVAGIAKLRIAGTSWLDGEQLRNHVAIDNVRKALLGDPMSSLAIPMLDHPALFTAFSITTLAIELGAPVALFGARVAIAWAIGAWLFHVGVLLVMTILFPYALFGFAYLPLFPVERPLKWVAARAGNVRQRTRS